MTEEINQICFILCFSLLFHNADISTTRITMPNCVTVTNSLDCFALVKGTSLLYSYLGDSNPIVEEVFLPMNLKDAESMDCDSHSRFICIYGKSSVHVLILPNRQMGSRLTFSKNNSLRVV